MKINTISVLLSLLAVTLDNSASARGGGGAAAAISRGGAGAAAPRGAGSAAAAMPRGTAVGGPSAGLRAGAAASMLRAGKGSALRGEVTLLIEAGSGRGTLNIRGSSAILRNSDGTFAAHLRTSDSKVYFYESDGATLRGFAEEFNGTIRLYRVSDSGEFVFEASEPSPARASSRSFARPTEHDQSSENERRAAGAASALTGDFVDIPGGTFQMGCSPGDSECEDDERPVHTVSIKPFRMGKHEVTVGQFRQFVEATGYRTDAERGGSCGTVGDDGNWKEQAGREWRNPGFPQTDRLPVVCVSWDDAEAYVRWLSRQGGGRYRLPSESEWEYAARAGGSARYSFGDSEAMVCQYGNVADSTAQQRFTNWTAASCDDEALYTAPVGGYRPNRFGLHDMHGNVWEWTGDCYHDSYAGAPSDGAAWTAGDCAERVTRGGSWNSRPTLVRSSNRPRLTTDTRDFLLRFRVLRDR